MSYCMYLRKSRQDEEAEARGEMETLSRHRKNLLELAKKLNLSVTQEYAEVVSGETIASRPVMQKLLSDVEKGIWEGVLVVEVERLARGDTIDQGIVAQTFKYSDTKIITPSKTYNPNNEFDEEYFEFGLFMSRREYKTINRRLQQGKLASVKDGKYIAGVPPYGYERVKIERDKGYTLKIIPEQAEIVKYIFKSYLSSVSVGVGTIAQQLNQMQAKPPKAQEWLSDSISHILRNPVYIGKIRHNYRLSVKKVVDGELVRQRLKSRDSEVVLVDGLHEAIIDDDTFYRVQKLLLENVAPKSYAIQNPLAGLMVCGVCGKKMKRNTYPDGKEPRLKCSRSSCTNVSTKLSIVENQLIETMQRWLKNYAIEHSTPKPNDEVQILKTTISQLDKELATLQKQMDSLYELLEQQIYTAQIFIERSGKIKSRIDTVTNDKNALEVKLKEVDVSFGSQMDEYIPRSLAVIEAYKKADNAKAKNELLKNVLKQVVYLKTSKDGRYTGVEDDFTLEFYPRFPGGI